MEIGSAGVDGMVQGYEEGIGIPSILSTGGRESHDMPLALVLCQPHTQCREDRPIPNTYSEACGAARTVALLAAGPGRGGARSEHYFW